MAHEFLLNADRSTRFVQERTIRVPEDMPTDIWNADLLSGGFQDLLLNHARVLAPASDMRREDESVRFVPLQVKQDLSESRIEGNLII